MDPELARQAVLDVLSARHSPSNYQNNDPGLVHDRITGLAMELSPAYRYMREDDVERALKQLQAEGMVVLETIRRNNCGVMVELYRVRLVRE